MVERPREGYAPQDVPPPDAPSPGRRFGRYLLQEEIGRGGMGVVHAALDETLGRRVALKLLRPGAVGDDAALGERFAQEMQIAVALEHPNIVPVHETGTEDGVRYIAMRLVDGEDLGAVLRREGALDPVRVARLGRQIAAALDAAHARGLVHRDVKPGNVLLTGTGDEEHAYLTDFGLTRDDDAGLTQTGQWIGTVDYAAPEQIEAGPLSARTDVYALGCVLYQMLSGTLPFTGSFAGKAAAHTTTPLPPVTVAPPWDGARLDAILAVATAKAPERRHASAGALARALARVVADEAEHGGQRTAAMAPVLLSDGEDDEDHEDAGPTAVMATEPEPEADTGSDATAVQPRQARRPPGLARPGPAPDPAEDSGGGDDRSRAPWIAAALVGIVGVLAAIALATGGGDDGASSGSTRADSSSSSSATSTPKKPTSTADPATSTSTFAPAPARRITTTSYTAPAGGYTADVPGVDGWTNTGEQDLGGVIRTRFTGPEGEQLWIDATPSMPPAFGREGRDVTEVKRIDGALGTIVGYRFTGAPQEFCTRGCVDYQLDLGGRGYAVIAGPTPTARLAARTAIVSLRETSPPPAAADAAGHAKPTKPKKAKGGK